MKLLACGAHADDVELGCGATLALAAERGHEVRILDLTGGELGSNGDPATRAREASRAAAVLKAAGRHNAGLPDGGLDGGDSGQRRRVVEWLRRLRPEILLIPARENRHPDHRQAHVLLEQAAFMAGLARYEADGEPHRPRAVFQYMERIPFIPSFVVAADAFAERKRAALMCYASQFSRATGERDTFINRPGFLEHLFARDRYYGGLVGCEYGEPFFCALPLGIGDPAALLPPGAQEDAPGRPARDRDEGGA